MKVLAGGQHSNDTQQNEGGEEDIEEGKWHFCSKSKKWTKH
jgi:hypothetical protein